MRTISCGLTSLAVALGLAAAAPAVGGTQPAGAPGVTDAHPVRASYVPPPIRWGDCDDPLLREFGAECGRLVVPRSYARPEGKKIRLAVSRMPHTVPDAQYQGVMLVNPGGPGGSGLIFSVFQAFVPNGAGEAYDWIGFDPRGVGSSSPSLSCNRRWFHGDRPNYVPRTRALMRTWVARSKRYAAACTRAPGHRLFRHVRTVDTVKDMESLRRALGVRQINYYGFSYGTYLGSVYATRHPERVRRFVLDANVDPRRVWYRSNQKQDIAFDRNAGVFFRWIAKYNSVYHLGSKGKAIERRYYQTRRQLDRRAARGFLGPDELDDVFTVAGYTVSVWPEIAEAYAQLRQRNRPGPLINLYKASNSTAPGGDNGYALYLGTQCTDTRWPQSQARLNRDNWRLYRRAPFLTWANAWFNGPCPYWHYPWGRKPKVSGSRVDAPVLLVSETRDAATSFAGSLEMRKRFPRASLVEGVNGTTHAASLSGVACVDNAVAAYLADGTVPPRQPGRRSDLRCPRVPPPDPTAAPSQGRLDAVRQHLREELLRAQLHR